MDVQLYGNAMNQISGQVELSLQNPVMFGEIKAILDQCCKAEKPEDCRVEIKIGQHLTVVSNLHAVMPGLAAGRNKLLIDF